MSVAYNFAVKQFYIEYQALVYVWKMKGHEAISALYLQNILHLQYDNLNFFLLFYFHFWLLCMENERAHTNVNWNSKKHIYKIWWNDSYKKESFTVAQVKYHCYPPSSDDSPPFDFEDAWGGLFSLGASHVHLIIVTCQWSVIASMASRGWRLQGLWFLKLRYEGLRIASGLSRWHWQFFLRPSEA